MSDRRAITVRLEGDDAEKLDELGRRLRNSDAGVLRFALDALYKAMAQAEPEIERAVKESVGQAG